MSIVNYFNRESWMNNAACLDHDPDLHFPKGGQPGHRTNAAHNQSLRAKEVCRGCQVRQPCLEYALENNEQYGVWGAFDADERAAMRRRNTIRQHTGEQP